MKTPSPVPSPSSQVQRTCVRTTEESSPVYRRGFECEPPRWQVKPSLARANDGAGVTPSLLRFPPLLSAAHQPLARPLPMNVSRLPLLAAVTFRSVPEEVRVG